MVKGFEARLQRADGAVTPVEVASARTSWGGKPAFQVIMRDVTERKLAEEEATARIAIERRYAAAVAALEEGVVVIDREGAVAAANDSAVEDPRGPAPGRPRATRSSPTATPAMTNDATCSPPRLSR